MNGFLCLGSSPPEENCAKVGQPEYAKQVRQECRRYIEIIRKFVGKEPVNCELKIKSFPHDFGTYYEVVCCFEETDEIAMTYAFKCENNGPLTWKG